MRAALIKAGARDDRACAFNPLYSSSPAQASPLLRRSMVFGDDGKPMNYTCVARLRIAADNQRAHPLNQALSALLPRASCALVPAGVHTSGRAME